MHVKIDNATIELDAAQLLRLKGAAGARIVCRSGTVWVTQEGLLRDDFLLPGESLTLRSRGVTLAQAIDRASFAIESPRTGSAAVATLTALPIAG